MGGDGLLRRMRLLTPARGESPWHTSLLHAMGLVTAALVLVDGAMGTAAGLPLLREGPLVWAGLATAAAAALAMAAMLARGVDGFRWHAGAVAAMLAGLSLVLWSTWEVASTPVWWPTRHLTATLMFIVVAGRTWHRAMLLTLVLAFHGSMRSAAWAAAGLPWGTDLIRQVAGEFGLAAFTASVMFVIMGTLLRAARMTDGAHAAAMRETRRATLAGATERSAREVERFVHDEVLHTLRTIAMDRRDVDASAAVSAAARLDGLLSESPTSLVGGTWIERLSIALRDLPLTVRITADPAITVPRDVEYSLTLATLEALRNVVRHARVTEAEVRIQRDGLTVEVEVRDRGMGFDVAAMPSDRGIHSSIHRRMEDVGGEAHLHSRPGIGTTVRLTWAAAGTSVAPRFAGGVGYGALGEVYPRASLITLPFLVYALWNAVWLAPALAAPWAGWAAAAVLTGATGAVVLLALRFGPRPWMAAALPLVAWGTTALNGWALPEGVVSPHLFWGGTAALAVVVPLTLFHHPALIAVTGLGTAALTAALTVLRAGPDAATGAFLGTIAQPAISMGAFLAVRIVLDSLAWEVYRTGEESARAQAEAQTRAEFVAAFDARMRLRRETIASFVHAVATGVLDPADPDVRARADALERAARDRMLPALVTDLHYATTRLRQLGSRVMVRLADDVPAEVQRHAAHALGIVAGTTPRGGGSDVTLTVMRAGTAWRTALVVESPWERLADHLSDRLGDAWSVSLDEDLLHLSTTVPVMAED